MVQKRGSIAICSKFIIAKIKEGLQTVKSFVVLPGDNCLCKLPALLFASFLLHRNLNAFSFAAGSCSSSCSPPWTWARPSTRSTSPTTRATPATQATPSAPSPGSSSASSCWRTGRWRTGRQCSGKPKECFTKKSDISRVILFCKKLPLLHSTVVFVAVAVVAAGAAQYSAEYLSLLFL